MDRPDSVPPASPECQKLIPEQLHGRELLLHIFQRQDTLQRTLDLILVKLEPAAALFENLAADPILTIEEAAKLARISTQRLHNLISSIKKETGRTPGFIVDAGGRLVQKVDRELFLDWIRSRRSYRSKTDKPRTIGGLQLKERTGS
jgi:hypothetical protein